MHVHGHPFTGQIVVNCTTKSWEGARCQLVNACCMILDSVVDCMHGVMNAITLSFEVLLIRALEKRFTNAN